MNISKIKRYGAVFALLCLLLTHSVTMNAQNQQVSLASNSVTVSKLFSTIEQQTGLLFVYSNIDLNTNATVTFSTKKAKLKTFLDQFASDENLKYEITPNKYIVLAHNNSIQSVNTKKRFKATGTVIGSDKEPIIGATVMQKGTHNGTITNSDGQFSIDVPEGSYIVVSYIGAVDKELKAIPIMNITLSENVENLNDVIVIGYGSMKKKDLTGSLATLNDRAISERHTSNISTALQGAVSGLSVTRGSGAPGATGTIRLRGTTTISTSDPLVIIDGVPGDINMVNPEDVENISILKDAASASIYGSRAAAGVILVQTKRAKKGDLKLSYNCEYALDSPTAKPAYANAVDYMKMANETRYNDNNTGGWYQAYSKDVIENYATLQTEQPDVYANTNWTNVLMNHSAPRQTHMIDLMAGGEKASTKISLRYDNIGAMYDNFQREHYLARINNDFYINKFIEAHADVNFRKVKEEGPNYDAYGWEGRSVPSIYPAIWSDGRYADVKDGDNPLTQISKDAGNYSTDNNHVGFKGELNFKPIEGLKISLIAAPNFDFNYNKVFVKKLGFTHLEDPNTIAGYVNAKTSLTENRNKSQDITTQFLINYNKSFGKHELTLMAGYEYYYSKYDNMSGFGDQFELTNYPYFDLAPKDYQSVAGNATEYSYRSWFGRVNYSYVDRYLLEANVRRDGSSRFASDNRWATFPSVSAGWVISEENFMKNTRNWLDQLKIRASWGKLGNERIGSYYPYQAAIDFGNVALMNNGSAISATTAAQIYYAVRNITWETTTSWDIGVDAVFFHNRLNFTFDTYRKNTTDMLLAVQIPQFLGYENPSVNAGEMHTTGWDFEAGWRDHIGDFNYNLRFNLSDATSNMGNLDGTVFYDGNYISREGTEFQQFYGYKTDGLFLTQDDLDKSAKINNNVKVGDVKFVDISGPDGVPDGKISAEYDRVPLKSSQPHFIYGLTFNGEYKGIDASVTLQGVGSQWAMRSSYSVLGLRDNWLNFPTVIEGKYWSANNTDEQNANATYPRLTFSNMWTNYSSSDYWLYNNHYLRCKNITLGYTLPRNITEKFFVNKLRFYVAANDLFSFNNCLKGWDPETTANGYPIMKSIMFGVNVNF